MSKKHFPWIASAIGLLLVAAVFFAGATSPSREYALPLLMMLFMSELGALVTAAGAFVGIRQWFGQRENIATLLAGLACAAMALALLSLGLTLWGAAQD